jgi:DNA-binding NarL/FixJ family response regulator
VATTTILAGDVEPWADIVRAKGGHIVAADGATLALFDSVSAAIQAAVAGQQAAEVARRRETGAASPQLGVHVTDVVGPAGADDEAALGSGAATARGLAGAAAPGEILVSELVRQLADPSFDTSEVELGDGSAWRIEWKALETAPVRVVVAEDSVLVRAGVVRLLLEEGFDVVADVGDADALLAAAREHHPELVVTDVRMPPTQTDEGITAAAALREEDPNIAVLVLSQHVEPAAASLLLSNNPTAVGYLLKERVSLIDEFIDACRSVAGGGVVIDPLVTDQLLMSGGADHAVNRLTEREREVLHLMAQGRSNAAIARELHCAPKTLEAHVRSIFGKLDMPENPDDHRRVAAVVRWLHASRGT